MTNLYPYTLQILFKIYIKSLKWFRVTLRLHDKKQPQVAPK